MADETSGKFRRSGNPQRLGNVLHHVVSSLGIDRRLREHTLMQLWAALVGEPWASCSRCLYIDTEGNLVVAVADASTGQELSLMKPALFKKVKAAAGAVGVDVRGLRLDLKHYHGRARTELDAELVRRRLPEPQPGDLDAVVLTEAELDEIRQLRLSLVPDACPVGIPPERILAAFEQELRLKSWRRSAGYPLCASCRSPSAVLHGDESLCSPCKFGAR